MPPAVGWNAPQQRFPVRKDGTPIPAQTEQDQPAGYMELINYYGSLEAAAYESNLRAIENGAALEQVAQVAQVFQNAIAQTWAPVGEWLRAMGVDGSVAPEKIPQILAEALKEHLQMYSLLNDVERLAVYFTEFNDWSLQQQGKPPMSTNLEYYQNLMNQQDQQAQALAQQQGGQLTPEQQAVYQQNQQFIQQQAQQAQAQAQAQGQRPNFPGGNSPNGSVGPADINQLPFNQRWRAIDQMGLNDWRNTRVTF